MLNDQMIELISVTSEMLALEEYVVEKDYYVTQMIHALSGTENEYFRLVFAGGTCLAKAHKIVKRMSEDVDFKIQVKNSAKFLSKSRILKELKGFREMINSKLVVQGLAANQPIVRNEGQYLRIDVKYPSIFPASARLRPHMLLEFTLSDIRLVVEDFHVRTLIEDTLENKVIFVSPSTPCVSIAETAIEKWVGLTRRIVAIEREYHEDDSALVRHIYDLYSINQADKIDIHFVALAKAIVASDANQFKGQHPEYTINPTDEIMKSLALLKNKPIWNARYDEFIQTMVYDNREVGDYAIALLTLENISKRVIDSFGE